jgi:hypothetical protein
MRKTIAVTVLIGMLSACQVPLAMPAIRSAAPLGALDLSALPPLNASLFVNGLTGDTIKPGSPAELAFQFADPTTGKPLSQFEPDHGKPMHLIAVSRDLSTFAHLHPALDARLRTPGRFTAVINQATTDPDNQDAARAIPKPGTYLLFAEVKPQGQANRSAGMTLKAEGTEQPVPLVPDQADATGTMTRYFTRDSQPGKAGDAYQVSLSVMPMTGMMHFTFHIAENAHAASPTRHYDPVTNLEPWLGMAGHGVLIGASGSGPQDRVFRHMHAGHGGHGDHEATVVRGGDHGSDAPLEFMLSGKDVPPAGLYRLWGQFKHKGRILTLPFTFRL